MNIRTKLIVMLAVPLVALAVVAFVGFAGQNADLEVNEDATVSVATITNLDSLWWAVADERLTVLGDGTAEEIAEAAAATDAVFEEILESADSAGAAIATEAVELLPADRSARTLETLDEYNDVLDALDAGIQAQPLAGLSSDAALTVTAIGHAHDASRQQEDAWLELKNIENLNTTSVRNLIASFGSARTLRDIAADDRLVNGDQLFLSAVRSPSAAQLGQIEALVLAELSQAEGEVLTDTFVDDAIASLPSISLFDALENNRAEWQNADEVARQILIDDIAETQTGIANARSRSLFLALVGGLLLFTLIFVIGRSIVGPLSRLMANADVMTHERLPAAVAQLRTLGASDETPELAPIPKESDDEIGTIVEAFNDMQVSALRVATDQARSRRNVAEMFVNLGRRNQQLNHRMITMISDLERDEQDPETLRGLYQLDHLATRMRRNAESLLVLAGNRSPRQWKKPVPFDDVVRSSLAEVEYFERIEIGDLPEVEMTGSVVADITHMLAELLDNATNFSEPSTSVHISAFETHTAVELQIRDLGFGIDDEDLRILNERLTNPPELDEAPSRLLGLFVVGRLAQQHGVHVDLRSVNGEGTTATVTMPKSLFPVDLGENPIDVPAPMELNADNAADFFAQEASLEANSEAASADFGEVHAEVIPLPIPDAVTESAPEPEPAELADISEINPMAVDALDAEPQFADEPVAMPEVAEIPEIPEMPEVAEIPDVPEVPEVAQIPDVPEVAEIPEMTEVAETLDIPVAEEASAPEQVVPDLEEAALETAGETADEDDADAVIAPSAAAELTEDSWPLTKLNPAPARAATPMDVAQRSAEVTTPAPEPVVEEPVIEASAPVVPVVESEPVVETPVAEVPQAPAPEAPAPVEPVVEEEVLPAPPVMSAPMPAPPAAVAPEVTSEPVTPVEAAPAPSTSTFGGLPTRMPQATIEEVESAPKVLPLTIEEDDAPASDKATSSISFGHFARGAVAASEATSANDEGDNA